MSYLTGQCEIDFKKLAYEIYGYSNEYHLGLPVTMAFLEEEFDFHFKKKQSIGELRELEIISEMIIAIRKANKLYNELKLNQHGKD